MQTISIPTGLYNFLVALQHNWLVIVLGIVLTIAASFTVFAIRHKYTLSELKSKETAIIQKLLLVISIVFGVLGYVVSLAPFATPYLKSLQSVPHLVEFVTTLFAAANFLYAIRLKKWFIKWTGWAKKEAQTNQILTAASTVLTQPLPQQSQSTQADSDSDLSYIK